VDDLKQGAGSVFKAAAVFAGTSEGRQQYADNILMARLDIYRIKTGFISQTSSFNVLWSVYNRE